MVSQQSHPSKQSRPANAGSTPSTEIHIIVTPALLWNRHVVDGKVRLNYVERLLPFVIGFGAYFVCAVVLSGQGVNGRVLLGTAWKRIVRSDGSWNYEKYPAPW